jgi:glycosyltransferase involved in cell wall biosynthesis
LLLRAPADAGRLGARLVHYTNAAAPLAGSPPYVVTVHDMSVARLPLTHPVARWATVPLSVAAVARARTVIVPSHWTARELARIGVDARRITVIPHAPTLARPPIPTDVVQRLGLMTSDYLLYVGTLEPRKNIARLVSAFELLGEARPGLQLVFAGAPGWRFRGIERRIGASPLRDRILLPGYLGDDDLATLIIGSAAVVYVSRYEGFGMPVLDALALGARVVTSRTTAMPEAAAGRAVLVDPHDEADIARGISVALDRQPGHDQQPAGLAHRTWADVAAAHGDVYRHALARL